MEQQILLVDLIPFGRNLYNAIQSTVPFQTEPIPGLHESLNHVYRELVTQVCMMLDSVPAVFMSSITMGHFPDMQRFDHIEFLQTPESYHKLSEAIKIFAVQTYEAIRRFIDLGNPMIETYPEAMTLDCLVLNVLFK